MKKERKEVKGNEVKELIKEVKLVVDYEYMCEEIKEKGVENKMNKEVKGVKEMNKKEVKGNENKGVKEVIKEVKLVIDNEYSEEIKEREEVKGNKGGNEMKESKKELVAEIEAKRGLLMEKVLQWALNLRPVRDIHVKVKGRYYPLIEKESGKLYVIDKVQGKKLPFGTLEDQMKFVIASVLAERKEQIEKEVEDGKRKYLEGKLQEINKLLDKF